MSAATLLLGFMAWAPTADRDAAPPLASTPDRLRDTNRCHARRCGRDRWKAPEAVARCQSPRDTSRGACVPRTYAGSRARAVRSDRLGVVAQSPETIARRPGGRTGATIGRPA